MVKGIPSASTLNTIVKSGTISRDKIIQAIKEGFHITELAAGGKR